MDTHTRDKYKALQHKTSFFTMIGAVENFF